MNGLIKFALVLAGLPTATIADIDADLPGAGRLIEAAKQLGPILSQAQPHIEAITPHIEALLPLLNKAMPILKAAYPDIVAILPTAKEIIAFVGEKKVAATASQVDASKSKIG